MPIQIIKREPRPSWAAVLSATTCQSQLPNGGNRPPSEAPRESRGCRGKIQYPDRKEAAFDLNDIRKKAKKFGHGRWTAEDIDRLNIYQCEECGYYHLGRSAWKTRGRASHGH